MTERLKQSTAVVIQFGPFVDKTDGVTLETGLVSALDHATTGILLSKNGGTLTIRHATVTASTYDAHGNYKVTLDTTDTNTLGKLRVVYTDAATCLPVWRDFEVVPAMIYDSMVLGSDDLDTNVAKISDDATAADNCELMFDGTGYAGGTTRFRTDLDTIKGQAITCAAGVTVLASVGTAATSTAQTGDCFARLGAPAGASVSADVAAVKVDTAAILVDTGTTLDARIPAALVGGRMDASVGAMAANVLTAAATASDFGAEVAAAVWDLAMSGHTTSGTFGEAMAAAGSAGDPWTTTLPGSYTSGQAGKILGDNLNATVSSRAVAGDAMALTSSERTTLAAAIWNALTSGMSTVGSIGKKLADWVVGTIDTYTGNTKQTGDSYPVVTHVTYGNSALHDDITNLQTYIDTEIAAILEDTGTTLPAQIAALNNLSAAQVNAEVLDVLATDTAAELGAVPAANASLKAKITFLAMLARNKITQTATTKTVFADDGSTQVAAATVSDDGTTYTRGELA